MPSDGVGDGGLRAKDVIPPSFAEVSSWGFKWGAVFFLAVTGGFLLDLVTDLLKGQGALSGELFAIPTFLLTAIVLAGLSWGFGKVTDDE